MKERLTVTLDPVVVRKAKALALARETNFSALIESLLRKDLETARGMDPQFTQKWRGKFALDVAEDDGRGQAILAKYDRAGT